MVMLSQKTYWDSLYEQRDQSGHIQLQGFRHYSDRKIYESLVSIGL